MVSPSDGASSNFSDLFDRLSIRLRAQRDGLLQHFELAHHADQADRGFGRTGVGALELPLRHAGVGGDGGAYSRVGDAEIAAALLSEAGGAGEVRDFELRDDVAILRDGAVGRDVATAR